MLKPTILLFLLALLCSCHKNGERAPVSSTPYFDSIINAGEHLYDSGYKANAIYIVRDAHATAKNLTVADEMNYLTFFNTIYGKTNEYEKSLAIGDTMLRVLEQRNEMNNLVGRHIQAYNIKADALMGLGQYNEAYSNYYKAQKLARDNADTCSYSKYSYSLGMVLFHQQRFLESAQHFRDAYRESSACRDEFNLFYFNQEVLDNTGLCYKNAGKYDSALYYYQKALSYINDNFNRFPHKQATVYIVAQAVVYGNMADAYFALGKTDTAIALFNKSLSTNLQKGYNNNDAIIEQAKLAGVYYSTGNIAGMSDLLRAIKAELDSIPDRHVELQWNKLMWQYYEHLSDSAKAFRYIKAYMALNDSFTAANKPLMRSDIDGTVRIIEKQYEVTENRKQEQLSVVIAAIVLLMAIVIIFLILKNAKRSRDNVKMLTDLNNKVNEQKEKLELALTELENKDRDKTRILRSVAHDVMNPIAAIVALTDIITNEADGYSDEHKEILSLIKEACANSLSLSKDILEAAVTIDPKSMTKEWVNINKLVTNSVELLNVQANAKKQHIIVTFINDNIQAFVNKEKIWRIINNLLTNAIKFSYNDSAIHVSLKSISGKVYISVKDKGIGIPEKNKASIFDMFTEAKLPGTSGEVPHGLGLSISLQIAKAHNGNIWFDSEDGVGTTFHFVFPINADDQPAK